MPFVGVTEHFLESLCLFLFQVGRFRRDLCSCDAARQVAPAGAAAEVTLLLGRELVPPDLEEKAEMRRASDGVPALMVSDAELEVRSRNDLELYRVVVRTLRQRVRLVEAALNVSIWQCGRAHR